MVANFDPKIMTSQIKKKITFILSNFLVRTLFQKKLKKKLSTKRLKKPPSKVAQKYPKQFSPITAKTAQTEEFMFQNVAYIPTVYKTGLDGRISKLQTKIKSQTEFLSAEQARAKICCRIGQIGCPIWLVA